jgi:hypothetical protein
MSPTGHAKVLGVVPELGFRFNLQELQKKTQACPTLRSLHILFADQVRLLVYLTERTNWRFDHDNSYQYRAIPAFLDILGRTEQVNEQTLYRYVRFAADFLIALGGGAGDDIDLNNDTQLSMACKTCIGENWRRIHALLDMNWAVCCESSDDLIAQGERLYPYQQRPSQSMRALCDTYIALYEQQKRGTSTTHTAEPAWKKAGLSRNPFKESGVQMRDNFSQASPVDPRALRRYYGLFDLVILDAREPPKK